MSLRLKLLSIYIVLGGVILLVVGGDLFLRLRSARFETIRSEITMQLEPLNFALINFISDAESGVQALAANQRIRTRDDADFTNFLEADEETFQYRITDAEQEIIDIFNAIRTTHPHVNSVYMGRENGAFVRSHPRARPTRYDPRERPWYILAMENPGRVVRTPPYRSVTTSDVNVGIVTALIDEEGEAFGVLGMDITLRNLTNYLSQVELGLSGELLLVDENGMVIASRDSNALFQHVESILGDKASMMMETSQGDFSYEAATGENHLFFTTCPGLGWRVGAIIPASEIDWEIRYAITSPLVVLTLGLTLLSALAYTGIGLFVLRPLRRLTDVATQIEQTGDLTRRIEIKSRDELGLVAKSFNTMVESLNGTQSALRSSEAELRRHKEELEDLVEQRTAELVVMKERAEDSDRLKSAFLAVMSHELRTPLNSIIGFTGIVLQGLAGPLSEEQTTQLGMVQDSARHLLELINDVLDISKIEAGEIDIRTETFNAREAIERAVHKVIPLAEKKNLTLSVEVAPEVNCITSDRRRTEQILINLINNAVKFTEQGEVRVECCLSEGKMMTRVRDTGIGIRPEDMDKLFKAFSQIDSGLARSSEGTGLGLSICRRLVKMLGGEIWVESEWGVGSAFTFTIPLEKGESGDEIQDLGH